MLFRSKVDQPIAVVQIQIALEAMVVLEVEAAVIPPEHGVMMVGTEVAMAEIRVQIHTQEA